MSRPVRPSSLSPTDHAELIGAETPAANNRILLVDDNRAIHDAIRRILQPRTEAQEALDALESEVFGDVQQRDEQPVYRIDSAYQGREALELTVKAEAEGEPYALAFLDVRMPPGWDGLETLGHLLGASPALQVVLCTAYSDHSWAEIVGRIGQSDGVFILKKPFEPVEVQQYALSLTRSWNRRRLMQASLRALRNVGRPLWSTE